MEEDTKKYQELLQEYRRVWNKVKQLQRFQAEQFLIQEQDALRDQIHNELRKLAQNLGKSNQDVDIDILVNEKDLAEFELPEFKVMNLKNLCFELDKPVVSRVIGANVLHPDQNEITKAEKEELFEDTSLFIPFGEEIAWHLFDHGEFLHREADNLERRRRAIALTVLTPAAVMTEVRSFETFHRGINLFGVVFNKQDFNTIITTLRTNREAVSIAPEYFVAEDVERDFELILQDDLENIKVYHDPKYKEETLSYLLEQYRRNCIIELPNLSVDLKNKALAQLDQEINNAKLQEMRENNETEVDNKIKKALDNPLAN